MIGGIEETSASFEARSAPRSYPRVGGGRPCPASPRHQGGLREGGDSGLGEGEREGAAQRQTDAFDEGG